MHAKAYFQKPLNGMQFKPKLSWIAFVIEYKSMLSLSLIIQIATVKYHTQKLFL